MRQDAPVIAIFDLDRTITRHDTFKAFLLFSVLRLAPWRLLALPLALVPALAFLARRISRGRLKHIMVRLGLGAMPRRRLQPCIEAFTERLVTSGCRADAIGAIRQAQTEGAIVVLATASFDFYVTAIAERLRIAHVVSTRSRWSGDDKRLAGLAGENCYDVEKLHRLLDFFACQGWNRSACFVRFYSDHHSDAPCLFWADQPVAVAPTPRLRAMAAAQGWVCLDWR